MEHFSSDAQREALNGPFESAEIELVGPPPPGGGKGWRGAQRSTARSCLLWDRLKGKPKGTPQVFWGSKGYVDS